MAMSSSSSTTSVYRQSITELKPKLLPVRPMVSASSSSTTTTITTQSEALVRIFVKETQKISGFTTQVLEDIPIVIQNFHTKERDDIYSLISEQVSLSANTLNQENKDVLIDGMTEFTNQCVLDTKTSGEQIRVIIFADVEIFTTNMSDEEIEEEERVYGTSLLQDDDLHEIVDDEEDVDDDMFEDDDDEVLRESVDMDGQNGSYGFKPASKNLIDKVKLNIYGTHRETQEDCCSICKEEFLPNDQVREMSCFHVFHDSCIVQWLLIQNSCPLCRSKID